MDQVQNLVELPRAVIDALDGGATVITSNQRTARTLRRAFDRRNREMGLESWQPASVFAWETWTATLWNGLLLDGHVSDLLLSRSQEHVVWRSIISADPEMRNTLRSVDSLADLAQDAWRLLGQYNAGKRFQGAAGSAESATFLRWASEFDRRCRNQQWMSSALLEARLQKLAAQLRLSSKVALLGFDDMLPSRAMLIESIRANGVELQQLDLSQPADERLLVCAEDDEQELKLVARWARQQMQRSANSRIAVIVPSLEERRNKINRVFRETLAPEMQNISVENHATPFEFSLGVKLSETPLVRVALDLLRWTKAPLPLERVSALLVSPLFAMIDAEGDARAIFDAFVLRKARFLRPEISLAAFTKEIARYRHRSRLLHLFGVLQALQEAADRYAVAASVRSYAEWSEAIHNLLRAGGWGRGSQEDSIEFQTRRRWEKALDELATLDFEGQRVKFDSALALLEKILQQILFAPESKEAPVQIMGPLEAAGSRFDAIWFLGAGDLTWPARSTANPLLPWHLQVDLGMPGTIATEDDRRACLIAERMMASASMIVFSYAEMTAAGKQRPTPAIESLPLSKADAMTLAITNEPAAPVDLEEFYDEMPLPTAPDMRIQGGADILRLQAACGFRAFAERRLWSTDLKNVEMGMDAAERGNVVHKTLEHFWNEVQTQSELKRMSTEQRNAALDRAIKHGLRKAVELSEQEWDTAYVEVQRQRLWTLLLPWIELELKRVPFDVKLSEKELKDVHIGPLRLSVRVDRVDACEEGDIIIDYKTGAARTADWQSERPDAPQLPLYAVLANTLQPETPLADVAFARMRPGRDMALDGFKEKITLEGSRTTTRRFSLDAQLGEWRKVLTDLAEAFHRGDARVDPKVFPLTCNYCSQRTLCRLDPAAFDEELDDEAAIDTGNG
ncbi:PD-(D/E)XK nuclease family protein [Edaphobacter flagellatus]|uniref:PD-(D/E)XK nuclease family protein n=1 Tax=Edaphobacter flagellatus TaxID=1933044 RepID=UPI0021B30CCA|nr:PD-(D/E)XK nuclease family protein [Edaphobacter flagellatus]